MKIILTLVAGCLFFSTLMATPPVNDKVLKAFNETFTDAKEIRWHEQRNQYIVHFVRDDIRCNVTYDKDGKLLNSKRYYSGDRLPVHIFLDVKARYHDKTITGVTEILDANGLSYFISLQDAKSLWTITLINEEVTEVKKWKKVIKV
jgi:hypothetical protein